MTLSRREAGLCRRRTGAAQRIDDRQPYVAGEVGGLIESALPSSGRVERDGDCARGAGKDVRASLAHQRTERFGEGAAAFIFEGVHDSAERAVVGADRAAVRDVAWRPPATRAARQRHADRAPGSERIAAAVA
jgi:methionine synthase I (cobalamin-dependent)